MNRSLVVVVVALAVQASADGEPCATARGDDCSYATVGVVPRTDTRSQCCPGASSLQVKCGGSTFTVGGSLPASQASPSSCPAGVAFSVKCVNRDADTGEYKPFTPTCKASLAPTAAPTPAPTPRGIASGRGGMCWDPIYEVITSHCRVPCVRYDAASGEWRDDGAAYSTLFDASAGVSAGFCCDVHANCPKPNGKPNTDSLGNPNAMCNFPPTPGFGHGYNDGRQDLWLGADVGCVSTGCNQNFGVKDVPCRTGCAPASDGLAWPTALNRRSTADGFCCNNYGNMCDAGGRICPNASAPISAFGRCWNTTLIIPGSSGCPIGYRCTHSINSRGSSKTAQCGMNPVATGGSAADRRGQCVPCRPDDGCPGEPLIKAWALGVASAPSDLAGLGYYFAADGTRTLCDPGYSCDGVTGERRACKPGFIAPTAGSAACEGCSFDAMMRGQTNKVAEEGPMATGATSCALCPAGQYAGTGFPTACKNCPAGKYQSEPGQSRCEDCSYNRRADGSTCEFPQRIVECYGTSGGYCSVTFSPTPAPTPATCPTRNAAAPEAGTTDETCECRPGYAKTDQTRRRRVFTSDLDVWCTLVPECGATPATGSASECACKTGVKADATAARRRNVPSKFYCAAPTECPATKVLAEASTLAHCTCSKGVKTDLTGARRRAGGRWACDVPPAPTTPTPSPTAAPTPSPTAAPTLSPTAAPTPSPTVAPTPSPTAASTPTPPPTPSLHAQIHCTYFASLFALAPRATHPPRHANRLSAQTTARATTARTR